MKYLDLSFEAPEENLACDEALLNACEEDPRNEILRFWQPRQPFLVVGYSERLAETVNLRACQEKGIPILRRCTGGGAVFQGPGCLNYALALKIGPSLESISNTNRFIMHSHQRALAVLASRAGLSGPISVEGITDLAWSRKKFSGNAQRRKRRALLFHGTFLISMSLEQMEPLLALPARQPPYREGRPHLEFLTNLPIPASDIKTALKEAWAAFGRCESAPPLDTLLQSRYASPEWTFRF